MQMDPCGCLWDWEGDTLNIVPCEADRDEVERATRIAWKLVARRKMSFRQAWEYLAMKFVGRLLRGVKKIVP
jgi:hypothetical protein